MTGIVAEKPHAADYAGKYAGSRVDDVCTSVGKLVANKVEWHEDLVRGTDSQVSEDSGNAPLEPDRQATDRLRDRTDELELIISSLTIFALFSIPGWLFDTLADVYTHLSTSLAIASNLSVALVTGVCYGLATCFVVHLMARAYWVGLIGLLWTFPRGINWDRTPGLGPLGREHFRKSLPDLSTVIQRTDNLASSLFAVISMMTLSVLWFGALLISTVVVSGLIGSRFGLTNTGMAVGTVILLFLFAGVPFIVYLLDRQLASRVPRLRESRAFTGTVRVLRRVSTVAYPQRLILPVQLTLQSNTRPAVFFVALTIGVVVIVVGGNLRSAAWTNFTLSGEFTYLDTALVDEGFNSTHYEDMATSKDRLRGWPRVDSFNQSGSFARLFLPYQPLRDNLVLDQLCADATEAPERLACLRQLWSVSINGAIVPMTAFVPAERGDLGMRGLIGLVPLAGLDPGLHRIEVIWNPNEAGQEAAVDDRYTVSTRTHNIPIAFAPAYELPLQ